MFEDYSVIEEFGLKRSTRRLKSGFVYTETINILSEIARETSVQNEFKSLINS